MTLNARNIDVLLKMSDHIQVILTNAEQPVVDYAEDLELTHGNSIYRGGIRSAVKDKLSEGFPFNENNWR